MRRCRGKVKVKWYWPSQIGGAFVTVQGRTARVKWTPTCRGAAGDYVSRAGKLIGFATGETRRGRVGVDPVIGAAR